MTKNINISTKVTLLILAVSLAAILAISFFSYDYHLKNIKEKYSTALSVIADNRAAYINTLFGKASLAVQVLQNSETLKGGKDLATALQEGQTSWR
jgi:uncharacterized membrane protein YgaE (UPF0421/DUF939 family)